MNSKFSVYTRDPYETTGMQTMSKTQSFRQRSMEESQLARKIRKTLHAHDPEAVKKTKAQRTTRVQMKKIARDQILSMLMSQDLVNTEKIRENLIDYATNELHLERKTAESVYGNSTLITTESNPGKSVFRIRIKI